MFNNLPIEYNPDSNVMIIALKDGQPVLIPYYKLQALSSPSIANQPTSFTATAFDSYQIDLAWTGTATNFVLERCRDNDGNWIEIYIGSTASFRDIDLSPECDYYYRVRGQEASKVDSDFATDNETTPAIP